MLNRYLVNIIYYTRILLQPNGTFLILLSLHTDYTYRLHLTYSKMMDIIDGFLMFFNFYQIF